VPDLFSVFNGQRACRRFQPDGEVGDDDVVKMLESPVRAPSAENTQPWSFVVRDARSRIDLAGWWTESWNAGGSEYARQITSDAGVYIGKPASQLSPPAGSRSAI
jgi:nitroreductase